MESLSDIETELRTLSQSSKYCELQSTVSGKPISFYFAEIADRIKAAAPTTEKSSAVEDRFRDVTKMIGNAAAIRHALIVMYDWILKAGNVYGYPDTEQKRRQLYDMMTKALSAPPRNCDVGTLQEQEARYHATGRLYHTSTLQNVLSWAQMPYKEKEGASK